MSKRMQFFQTIIAMAFLVAIGLVVSGCGKSGGGGDSGGSNPPATVGIDSAKIAAETMQGQFVVEKQTVVFKSTEPAPADLLLLAKREKCDDRDTNSYFDSRIKFHDTTAYHMADFTRDASLRMDVTSTIDHLDRHSLDQTRVANIASSLPNGNFPPQMTVKRHCEWNRNGVPQCHDTDSPDLSAQTSQPTPKEFCYVDTGNLSASDVYEQQISLGRFTMKSGGTMKARKQWTHSTGPVVCQTGSGSDKKVVQLGHGESIQYIISTQDAVATDLRACGTDMPMASYGIVKLDNGQILAFEDFETLDAPVR